MSPTLAAPNFGSNTLGASAPGDGAASSLADRFADCAQGHTVLESGAHTLDTTAPWAGDRRTVPFSAHADETGEHLADRILRDSSLAGDFDSITLLTSTGIGRDLQAALAARGRHVRVYEASTELRTEPRFTIVRGGHWEVFGGRTVTHNFAITRELTEAYQTDFPYAARSAGPRADAQLSDRAETLSMLGNAVAAVRQRQKDLGGTLDLTAAVPIVTGHEAPQFLWRALMEVLSGELGSVSEIADMYRDEQGAWHTVPIPIEVRRKFTATGPHRLGEDGLGVRMVSFNKPQWLLDGAAAATRPKDIRAYGIWLAERTVDLKNRGLPVEAARIKRGGNTQRLHQDLVRRLVALNVSRRDANLWADESINGVPAPAETAPQIAAAPVVESSDGDVTPFTTVDAPLGGGVLAVLRNVPGTEGALAAGQEMAAHFLHDQYNMDVASADAATAPLPIASADVLTEVVALLYLHVQAVVAREAVPILLRQPLPGIISAISPVLGSFLTSHLAHIEEVISRVLGHHPGDTLRGLVEPELIHESAGPIAEATADITAPESSVPWRLPEIGLRIVGDSRPEIEEIVRGARAFASLNTALGMDAGLTEALTTEPRSAALARLHDAVDGLKQRYPWMAEPARTMTVGIFDREIAHWLANALATLGAWSGGQDDSVERVGQVLTAAGAVDDLAEPTAPALAWALAGEWREVSMDGLWALPHGSVTVVWAQRESAPEHVVLVERTTSGLAVVETQTAARAEISLANSQAAAANLFGGPARVVVDTTRHIVMLGPTKPASPEYQPPQTNGGTLDGLAAPRFGSPATTNPVPGGIAAAPGITRLGTGRETVLVIDVQSATSSSIESSFAEVAPSGGALLVHGRAEAHSSQGDFGRLARASRLHFLEPLPSQFPEPMVATFTAGHVISPTGWWIAAPDGTERRELRGALPIDQLFASPGTSARAEGDATPLRIASAEGSARDEDPRPGEKTPAVRSAPAAIRPLGTSPHEVAENIWVYPPGGDHAALHERVGDRGRAMSPAVPPNTVVINGLVVSDGQALGILDDTRAVNARQVITAFARLPISDHPIGDMVLALALHGEHDTVLRFAQRLRELLDRDALLGRPGPALVVGHSGIDDPMFVWHAVESHTRNVRIMEDLGEAVAAVRGRTPQPVDVARELRNRMGGFTRIPEVTHEELIARSLARGAELPTYSAESEVQRDSFPEVFVAVPVRPGAHTAERMDAARTWLNPYRVRETITKAMHRDTSLIRIGAGLSVYAHFLPASGLEPPTTVTTVQSEGKPVWVNRHPPIAVGHENISLTAVALPGKPVQADRSFVMDWSFLDRLPLDVLKRLTIEPGEVLEGRLVEGDVSFSAADYAAQRLHVKTKLRAFLGIGKRPIVILPNIQQGGDEDALNFSSKLSSQAHVIRLVTLHESERSSTGGEVSVLRAYWQTLSRGKVVATTRDLGAALQRWHVTEDPMMHTRVERTIASTQKALDLLRANKLGGPGSEDVVVIHRELARALPYEAEMAIGWLSLPRSANSHGLIQNFLRHIPSGLIALHPAEVPRTRNVKIRLPVRYVGRIFAGDSAVDVVDLAELAATRAYLRPDGQIIVPAEPGPGGPEQRLVDLLREQAGNADAAVTPDNRIGHLFRTLTGSGTSSGGSVLRDWAKEMYADVGWADRSHLAWLRWGAVTPVWLEDGNAVVAVGTDQTDKPALFGLDGTPVGPEVLTSRFALPIDSLSRLIQVDLSRPGEVIVYAHGAMTEPPGYTEQTEEQIAEEGRVDEQIAEERVAEEIRAEGFSPPDDLGVRLSRRLSTPGSRRISFVTRTMAHELAQELIHGEPVGGLSHRASLHSRVSRFLAQNGSQVAPETIDPLLNEAVADVAPGLADFDLPVESIRGIGLAVQRRLSVRLTKGSLSGETVTGAEHDAHTQPVIVEEEGTASPSASVRNSAIRESSSHQTSGQSAPKQQRSLPPPELPAPEPAGAPIQQRGSSLPTPPPREWSDPVPPPPVVIFKAVDHAGPIHVIIVDVQRAHGPEVEAQLNDLHVSDGRLRGFLALRQANHDSAAESLYGQLALDRGLRLVRPAGPATTRQADPFRLTSPTGWLVTISDPERPLHLPATGPDVPLDPSAVMSLADYIEVTATPNTGKGKANASSSPSETNLDLSLNPPVPSTWSPSPVLQWLADDGEPGRLQAEPIDEVPEPESVPETVSEPPRNLSEPLPRRADEYETPARRNNSSEAPHQPGARPLPQRPRPLPQRPPRPLPQPTGNMNLPGTVADAAQRSDQTTTPAVSGPDQSRTSAYPPAKMPPPQTRPNRPPQLPHPEAWPVDDQDQRPAVDPVIAATRDRRATVDLMNEVNLELANHPGDHRADLAEVGAALNRLHDQHRSLFKMSLRTLGEHVAWEILTPGERPGKGSARLDTTVGTGRLSTRDAWNLEAFAQQVAAAAYNGTLSGPVRIEGNVDPDGPLASALQNYLHRHTPEGGSAPRVVIRPDLAGPASGSRGPATVQVAADTHDPSARGSDLTGPGVRATAKRAGIRGALPSSPAAAQRVRARYDGVAFRALDIRENAWVEVGLNEVAVERLGSRRTESAGLSFTTFPADAIVARRITSATEATTRIAEYAGPNNGNGGPSRQLPVQSPWPPGTPIFPIIAHGGATHFAVQRASNGGMMGFRGETLADIIHAEGSFAASYEQGVRSIAIVACATGQPTADSGRLGPVEQFLSQMAVHGYTGLTVFSPSTSIGTTRELSEDQAVDQQGSLFLVNGGSWVQFGDPTDHFDDAVVLELIAAADVNWQYAPQPAVPNRPIPIADRAASLQLMRDITTGVRVELAARPHTLDLRVAHAMAGRNARPDLILRAALDFLRADPDLTDRITWVSDVVAVDGVAQPISLPPELRTLFHGSDAPIQAHHASVRPEQVRFDFPQGASSRADVTLSPAMDRAAHWLAERIRLNVHPPVVMFDGYSNGQRFSVRHRSALQTGERRAHAVRQAMIDRTNAHLTGMGVRPDPARTARFFPEDRVNGWREEEDSRDGRRVTMAIIEPPVPVSPPDPGGDRRYGRGGTEAEDHSGYLQIGGQLPESVHNFMRNVVLPASEAQSGNGLLGELVERRFGGTGLREQPSRNSATMEAREFVDAQVADPSPEWAHLLPTWDRLRGLIEQAGRDGMVVTPASRGHGNAVYMSSENQIWEIRLDDSPPVLRSWTMPSALTGELPPRYALAFNHCADPIRTSFRQ